MGGGRGQHGTGASVESLHPPTPPSLREKEGPAPEVACPLS